MILKEEKGQSLLEFAIILPILLILISGIFDFGRILYAHMHLHLATQETVRIGSLGEGDAAMLQYVQDYVHLADPESLQISISPEEADRKSGQYMQVSIEYPMQLVTPFVSRLFSTPLVIKTDSTIRIE